MRKSIVRLIIWCFLISCAAAQDTQKGQNWADYNIVNSLELGYRFATVGGNYQQYESTVNYRDGIRLLSSYFTMNSKNGHGKYFDELVITTQGLGNDPYENANLRIQKNKLYRYDLTWRRNDYLNPGLTTGGAGGQHLLDTRYDMQDHDFTLFPDSKFKFFLGYTGTSQTGAGLSSIQLFDSRGSIYPLFANIHRVRNEYRAGNEFRVWGFRVNWMHGWEDFKEDSPLSLAGPGLTSYSSAQPYHGSSPYWRVALFRDWKHFSMNGRFTNTAGQRGFIVDESASGLGRFGQSQDRQVISLGNASRPVTTGNLNLTWLPAPKLTVTNATSVYSVRTNGNSEFLQYDNATQSADLLYYEYLGIRTVSNQTDINYQALKWLGISGGYQYSNRLIRSVEQVTIFGSPSSMPYQQTNHLNAGTLALRLRLRKGLTAILGAEAGHNDQPFTPVAGKNYHALNGRLQYRAKGLTLLAAAQSDYRFTPVSLSAFSAESRTYSANASWTAKEWLSFDAGYSRLHTYTLAGIAYFANFQLVSGDRSLYLSNINTISLGARFAIRKYADLYVGYNRIQDAGDGRSTPTGPGIASASPVFQGVQTFPIAFDSPLARLSIRLHERVRWNFGYQYYGLREKFYPDQNYRANTGFSSVTWSF